MERDEAGPDRRSVSKVMGLSNRNLTPSNYPSVRQAGAKEGSREKMLTRHFRERIPNRIKLRREMGIEKIEGSYANKVRQLYEKKAG